MKQFSTSIILIFFIIHLFGQGNFLVGSRQFKTGSIIKEYAFFYELGDSIHLFFFDSTITFINPTKTIKKVITYSHNKKDFYSINNIYLRTTNGEDSISEYFSGGKLSITYTEFRDSMIKNGKIIIKTIFNNAEGHKKFSSQVLSEYDNKNRKIKEIFETKINDPATVITTYKYDGKDSLIEERVNGIRSVLAAEYINTLCYKKAEMKFTVLKFNECNQLIRQLIQENKSILNSNKCENLVYTYISSDKQTELIIRKTKPYWEGGLNVSVIVTEIY